MTMKVTRKGARRPWQDEKLGQAESSEAGSTTPKTNANVGAAGGTASGRQDHENYDRELPHLRKIAKLFTSFGHVFNRFESHGSKNIPQSGPALIVFYHALVPLDAWYFGMQFYLSSNRLIHALGDRWLFRIPGMKQLAEAVGIVEASPDNAIKLLQEGRLVAVAPGGVREAVAGQDKQYELQWENRTGFAALVKQTGVPVIPAFSQNSEQMYVSPLSGSAIFQNLYRKTRLPLVPILGLGPLPLPVKVTTWIGKPLTFKSTDSVEFIQEQTRTALEGLIRQHQSKSRTVGAALRERLTEE